MTKNIHILLIEDSYPIMKGLNKQFATTEEKKYICPNYDSATEVIEKISQNFNEHQDFLFVALDRDLGHSNKDGVDLFFQLHNTFPANNVFIVNFSSNPEDFEQAIAQKNDKITFDAQTTQPKNPVSCKNLFNSYQENLNRPPIIEEASNEINGSTLDNSTNTQAALSRCFARFLCGSTNKYINPAKVFPENN